MSYGKTYLHVCVVMPISDANKRALETYRILMNENYEEPILYIYVCLLSLISAMVIAVATVKHLLYLLFLCQNTSIGLHV